MTSYKPHQLKASFELSLLLEKNKFAYLAGEPRSGKTRTAIRTCVLMGYQYPLVLTKKNAIPGWERELEEVGQWFHVTNYERVSKLDPRDYDCVILDEAHNYGSRGRMTKRFKETRRVAADKPLLCLSGTPIVETPLAIYHQTAISRHGPFSRFRTFYDFWRAYGIPNPAWFSGRQTEQYNRHKPELVEIIGQHTVTLTQDDAGIEHKAQDTEHCVSLSRETKELLNGVLGDSMLGEHVLDSDMAVRAALHQIESGAVLIGDDIVMLENDEVLEYCLRNFHPDDTAIMCHYRSTRQKFKPHYPSVFSSNAHAEGVDLSHFRHFVIINSDYSGAKFVQRRDRIVNMKAKSARIVHHITTDGGISRQIYQAVSNKKDFNLAAFRQWRKNEVER